jgi:hypothetical protein
MKSRSLRAVFHLSFILLLTATLSWASSGNEGGCKSQVVPDALKKHPKARYYLAFFTRDERNAMSANINDYNEFVKAQADQCAVLKKIEWKAVASTPTKSADENLDLETDPPIYLLDGTTRVVPRAGNVLSGANLEHAINEDQFARQATDLVTNWTGTDPEGQIADPLGKDPATRGHTNSVEGRWVDYGSGSFELKDSLYAISQLLTVPEMYDSSDLRIEIGADSPLSIVLVGEVSSVSVSVRANDEPAVGAVVDFTTVLGDVQFANGKNANAGRQSTITTDVNGEATAQVIARQPGLSIVQVKAGGSSIQLSVSATTIPFE